MPASGYNNQLLATRSASATPSPWPSNQRVAGSIPVSRRGYELRTVQALTID